MTNPNLIFEYIRYPIIPVKFFFNGRKTPYIDALLDSGGDFIVIPLPIAQYLDLKLKKAGSVDTAGGAADLFKAKLDMVIGKDDNTVTYEKILIHVSARNDIPVLIGRHPIFEDYEIVFSKHKNQVILNSIKEEITTK